MSDPVDSIKNQDWFCAFKFAKWLVEKGYLKPNQSIEKVIEDWFKSEDPFAKQSKKDAEKKKCCYSHVCKLCGEEIVWSITEHLVDKHPDIPEVRAYKAWAAMLWAKFVENK